MSKPRGGHRPDMIRRTRDVGRYGYATCAECGKRAFLSKKAAKSAARVLYPGYRMRVYACGRWWHMTSQDAAQTAATRGRGHGA